MKNYNKGEKVSIKRCYEVHINGYITDVCPGEVGTVHWDCGDTVEVYFGDYIMLEVNKEDIEPCISEEAEEVTIDGWVAIDEAYDTCFLHTSKPHQESQGIADTGDYTTVWESDGKTYLLDKGFFPDMDSDSEPLEVTITIKPKKQLSTK